MVLSDRFVTLIGDVIDAASDLGFADGSGTGQAAQDGERARLRMAEKVLSDAMATLEAGLRAAVGMSGPADCRYPVVHVWKDPDREAIVAALKLIEEE